MTDQRTGIAGGSLEGAVEFDFDHWSSKSAYAPHDTWSRLRNECPVAHSPHYGGFFVLSRYQDVYDALVTPEIFSNEGPGTQIPSQPGTLLPQDLDPPNHHKYRTIINSSLTPQALAPHEGWIREFAEDLMDKLADREGFDYSKEFAQLFPTGVVWRIIGFPPEDLAQVSKWIEVLATTNKENDEAPVAAASIGTYLAQIVERRKAEPPSDDLIGAIVAGTVDDRPLSDDEMVSYLFLLLFGGLHTTTSALATMALWLAGHPEDRKRLRENLDDRVLVNLAVDEFLRYSSPVVLLGRTVKKDAEFAGCPFHEGDRVAVGFGPANFDPEQFERPDEVILDRRPNKHLSFGMGPHRCVGSHLARLEIRVALEVLLTRVPDFEVADYSRVRWVGGEGRAIMSLPLAVGR